MLDLVWQDIRYAIRSLARRPLVTSGAVLSLALGIGVNTAIFSVFERLILRELPVAAPDDLVLVTSPGPKPGSRSTSNAGGVDHVFSYPLFRDLERLENTGLSRIAAHRGFTASISHDTLTTRADAVLVSGGYFPALGVSPALGRLLTADDDRVAGAHPVAVLAHPFWQARFGGDRTIIGDTLIVNGEPTTIVGVAAEGFTGTTIADAPALFVPLAMAEQLRAGGVDRRNHSFYLFARRQPGVTREQAEAAVNGPFSAFLRDEAPLHGADLSESRRQAFLARRVVLEDGSRGRMADRNEAGIILLLLFAITGLVLLIACANLANLLLVRAAGRSTEIAMRLSLGASAGRVLRLLLVEAGLLGVTGAVAALAVAKATFLGLMALMPASDQAMLAFALNPSILWFTLALGLGTSLLFGLFPALHSLRSGTATGAESARASASGSAARFRTSLATAQIALATALLAQAGLFITSLVNVGRTDLGIQRDGLITFRLWPSLNGYSPERVMALFDRVEEQLRQVPGVISVTASTVPVLADNSQAQNVTVEGFNAGPDADVSASFAATGTGYFRTLGIPLLAGRDFSRADARGAAKVAIVNEAFARKFDLGSEAVGRYFALGNDNVPDIRIVGVVADAKYSDVRQPAPPQFYLPYRQSGAGLLTFYVRSSGDPGQLRLSIPALVAREDPGLPVERLRTMDEQIWDNVTRDRLFATLSSWFAGLATLLAAVGLYAVLAYTVAQRLREIGIRMALGARPSAVLQLVLGHVGRMTLIGGAIGLTAALGLGRLGEGLLFGVKGTDPVVILSAFAAVTLVTLCAAAVPARRATRIDPAVALRTD